MMNTNENIYDDATSSTTTVTAPTAIRWKTHEPQHPSTTRAAPPTRFSSSSVAATATNLTPIQDILPLPATTDMLLPPPTPPPPPPSPETLPLQQQLQQTQRPSPPPTSSDQQEREQPPPSSPAAAKKQYKKKTVTFADDITRVDFHDDFNGSLHDIEPIDCDVSHLYYSSYELDQISNDINKTIRLAVSLLDHNDDDDQKQPQDTAICCVRGLESQMLRKICCQKCTDYGSSGNKGSSLYSTSKAKTKRREIRKNRIQSIQAVLVEQYYQQQQLLQQLPHQANNEYEYVGDHNDNSNRHEQEDLTDKVQLRIQQQNDSQLAQIYAEYSQRSIEQAIQMGAFDEQQAVTDSLHDTVNEVADYNVEEEVTSSPFYSSLLIGDEGSDKEDANEEHSSTSATTESDDNIYIHCPTTTTTHKSSFPHSYYYYNYNEINNKETKNNRHNYDYKNDRLSPTTTTTTTTTTNNNNTSPLILSIVALD